MNVFVRCPRSLDLRKDYNAYIDHALYLQNSGRSIGLMTDTFKVLHCLDSTLRIDFILDQASCLNTVKKNFKRVYSNKNNRKTRLSYLTIMLLIREYA